MSITSETLAWLHHSAAVDGAAYSQVLLHLLERVEALEQKYETQKLATLEWGKDVDKLMRWIDDHLKRIMALEAAQQPHQDKLDRLIVLDADAPTPEAAPPDAPAGGLMERVVKVIADPDGPAELWHDDARAAIREVAAAIDQMAPDRNLTWERVALWLEREAKR